MDAPVIDVIIPNRNKAAFLPATLASLEAQTESRWRAIVIDGESNDGSWEILQAAARRDSRYEVRSARPASVSGLSIYRSWNHGLLQVRAPYFAILTSDDLWEPDWLRRAIGGLETHPRAIASAARAIAMDEGGEVSGPTVACRQLEESFGLEGGGARVLASEACLLRSLLFGPIFSTIHALVFRRRLLEEGVLFAEDIGFLADIEYYLHACLLGDVVYDLDSRALFRLYAGQASSEAKGATITQLWSKVVNRNRRLVAQKLKIPVEEVVRATNEILGRHQFIMTKPDRRTLKEAKALAVWRTVQAAVESPRLALKYAECRGDRDRFLQGTAVDLLRQLSAKYAI